MKTVIFVTNIDDGLIGKTICGYQLRKVYTGSSDRSELLTATMYSWEFANSLFLENDRETGCLQEPATNKTVRVDSFLQKDLSGSYYRYFIKEYDSEIEDKEWMSALRFVQCLSLFSDSGISFSYPYGFIEGKGVAIIQSPLHNYKSIYDWGIFKLSECEIETLECFYNSFLLLENEIPNGNEKKEWKQTIKTINGMIDFWMEARKIANIDIKFIMHVSILEMLIDSSNELSYRISRAVAIFLGLSKQESRDIYKNVRNLYNARSRFLHDGESNDDKNVALFYDNAEQYARQVVVKLIQETAKGLTITIIREAFDSLGYGEYSAFSRDFR